MKIDWKHELKEMVIFAISYTLATLLVEKLFHGSESEED